MKLKLNKKQIVILAVLLILILILPLTLSLTKQRQEIRKKAAAAIYFNIEPKDVLKQPNDIFTVNIVFVSNDQKQIRSAGVDLQYDPAVFTPSQVTCGNSLPLVAKNEVDTQNSKIYLSCGVAQNTLPLSVAINQVVTLGTFQIQVKNNAPSGDTVISYIRTVVADENYNEIISDVSNATYTIGAATSPTPATQTCAQFCTSSNLSTCAAAGWSSNCENKPCGGNTNDPNKCGKRTKTKETSTTTDCANTCYCYTCETIECGAELCDTATCSCNIPSIVTVTPPPVGQVKILFKIKFAGINDKKPDQKIKYLIQTADSPIMKGYTGYTNVTSDSNGVYSGSIYSTLEGTNIPAGKYHILIKGPKHLQVKYCANKQTRPCTIPSYFSITLVEGENELDFTGYPLPGGDLPLPQDGVVNAIDAVTLTTCFETPTKQDCLDKADLNFDGIINSMDMNLVNNTIYTRWEDE